MSFWNLLRAKRRDLVLVLVGCVLVAGCREDERRADGPRPGFGLPPHFFVGRVLQTGGPLGDACGVEESFTMLLDGMECADERFAAAVGQPSAVLSVREPDGRAGIVLIDVGSNPDSFEQNLAAWLDTDDSAGRRLLEKARRAVVFSHAHAGAPVLASHKNPGNFVAEDSLGHAFKALGDVPVQGPNINDLCGLERYPPGGPAQRACAAAARDFAPGVHPLVWDDGTVSQRVWFLTYDIAPPERDRVPFQPLESLTVVDMPAGYLVYSVCSHVGEHPQDGHQFHAVERVAAAMAAGTLPKKPIHTLVTGLCGVERSLRHLGSVNVRGHTDSQAFREHLTSLRDRLGIERVFLAHCALNRHAWFPVFAEVFGDAVRLAFPGTCIPLRPGG